MQTISWLFPSLQNAIFIILQMKLKAVAFAYSKIFTKIDNSRIFRKFQIVLSLLVEVSNQSFFYYQENESMAKLRNKKWQRKINLYILYNLLLIKHIQNISWLIISFFRKCYFYIFSNVIKSSGICSFQNIHLR